MGKAHKNHEAINGLFAGIQPTYSMRDLLPEVLLGRTFWFENTLKAKSTITICMLAVIQSSDTIQSNHPHRCLQEIHLTVQI